MSYEKNKILQNVVKRHCVWRQKFCQRDSSNLLANKYFIYWVISSAF